MAGSKASMKYRLFGLVGEEVVYHRYTKQLRKAQQFREIRDYVTSSGQVIKFYSEKRRGFYKEPIIPEAVEEYIKAEFGRIQVEWKKRGQMPPLDEWSSIVGSDTGGRGGQVTRKKVET